MGKSPGFWFFTGDWLKDSELRFCSIFARGLLVDLLCLMFEAKQRGYLSKPDGTPRSNEDIVDAVSGSDRAEKLKALAELESSGVLSRSEKGVLFSRRLARLGEISDARSKSGSKGGSKTKAKSKQSDKQDEKQSEKQNDQQKQGVTVSDSVSDSDSILTHTHTEQKPKRDSAIVPSEIAIEWQRWCDFRESCGKPVNAIQAEATLMELSRRGWDKAKRDIDFSIRKDAKSILDSDNDFEKRSGSSRQTSPEKQPPVWA